MQNCLQQLGQHVQLGVRLDAFRPFGELLRDGAVLGADAVALGQVPERFSERARRGAQPLPQVDEGQLQNALLGTPAWCPLLRLFLLRRLDEAFLIQPSEKFSGALVQVRLGARELHFRVARPAGRQIQVVDHARAPGADHHLLRQRA